MATLRLQSGVCVSTDNESIIQQYLKYGAVEVIDTKSVKDIPDTNKVEVEPKKSTSKKKNIAE